MTNEHEVVQIVLPTKTINLHIQSFDEEVQVDTLLQIDHTQLLLESITFPVIYNRIAILRADMQAHLSEQKLHASIKEAVLKETYRKSLAADKGKSPTIGEVDSAVMQDKQMRKLNFDLIEVQKQYDYIDALYISARSKDNKLNQMVGRITPDDFSKDILEGAINGVLIKTHKNIASHPLESQFRGMNKG